ncbi:MAG: nicotinamide mononucleotide transporter [Phycisphaerales bacterium]
MTYDGFDWLGVSLTFLAVYLIGAKHHVGFIVFAVANVMWITVGFMADSSGILIGNVGFFAMNLHNYWKWHKNNTSLLDNENAHQGRIVGAINLG